MWHFLMVRARSLGPSPNCLASIITARKSRKIAHEQDARPHVGHCGANVNVIKQITAKTKPMVTKIEPMARSTTV